MSRLAYYRDTLGFDRSEHDNDISILAMELEEGDYART